MAAINDITGDTLRSKTPSKAYSDNFDAIFRKKLTETPVAPSEVTTDKPVESPES